MSIPRLWTAIHLPIELRGRHRILLWWELSAGMTSEIEVCEARRGVRFTDANSVTAFNPDRMRFLFCRRLL